MRLATIRTPHGTRAARIIDGEAVLLPDADVGQLLTDPDWKARAGAHNGDRIAVNVADLAPVVPCPAKFMAIGFNFASHVDDQRQPGADAHPSVFAKFARSLIGARDDIELPHQDESVQIDWEIELAVIIGQPARRVTPAQALRHVAGYTVTNDLSVRDWQFRTRQALQGKAWEHMTPLGPWLVTPEEVGDPASLRLQCEIDGVLMQDATAAEMIFDAGEIIAYVSSFITLEPGDVLSLGTPAGAAIARTPPSWLSHGSEVRSRIVGIGELVNRCVAPEYAPVGRPVAAADGSR